MLAPTPLVTVTVEAPGDEASDVHFHAGGQGVWVARLAGALGGDVHLATLLGGESGRLLATLLATEGVTVHAVRGQGANGCYVHDRRSGARRVVAEVARPHLTRHEADDLYDVAFTEGLSSTVTVLTGAQPPDALDADVYRRLAADLRAAGVVVVADLTGPALAGALAGGVDVLKLNDQELVAGGLAQDLRPVSLYRALDLLQARGARTVIASRAAEPALVLFGADRFALGGPVVTPADPRGAGDSMVAALAVALAEGRSLPQALRLGAASGALNATRHGLGTGERRQIERLAMAIELTPAGSVA